MAWFNEHLNDPKSLEIVAWGHPEELAGANLAGQHRKGPGIALLVKYRAANAMGGLTLSEQVFIISNGKVQDVVDLKDFISSGNLVEP